MNTRLIRLRLILLLVAGVIVLVFSTSPPILSAQGAQTTDSTQAAPNLTEKTGENQPGAASPDAATPIQVNLLVIHSALIPISYIVNIPIVLR